MDVGSRIVELRTERNMSQYALYKKAGVSQGQLSQYEGGKKAPGVDVLERICEAMNVTLSEFFDVESKTPLDDRAARLIRAEAKRLGVYREDNSTDEEALNRMIRFLRSGAELIGHGSQDF